jgi:hypothetical protein
MSIWSLFSGFTDESDDNSLYQTHPCVILRVSSLTGYVNNIDQAALPYPVNGYWVNHFTKKKKPEATRIKVCFQQVFYKRRDDYEGKSETQRFAGIYRVIPDENEEKVLQTALDSKTTTTLEYQLIDHSNERLDRIIQIEKFLEKEEKNHQSIVLTL